MLWEGLTDTHVKLPMGMTAENLADQYGLTREDCDRYAVQSQERWQKGGASVDQNNCFVWVESDAIG